MFRFFINARFVHPQTIDSLTHTQEKGIKKGYDIY